MKKRFFIFWGLLLGSIFLLFIMQMRMKKQETASEKVEEIVEDSYTIKETSIRKEKKKIALTFDDGPHPIYTPEMLELLKKYEIPATFFLLGEQIEQYEDLVKEIANEGHLIGNHTFEHIQITKIPEEQAEEMIQKTSDLIEELTGQKTEYVRPPFGSWDQDLEEELDLIPVLWNVDSQDWKTQNVDSIVNQVVKSVKENDIILMHDSFETTVQAVERIIKLLEAEGYEFVTVDEVIMD